MRRGGRKKERKEGRKEGGRARMGEKQENGLEEKGASGEDESETEHFIFGVKNGERGEGGEEERGEGKRRRGGQKKREDYRRGG